MISNIMYTTSKEYSGGSKCASCMHNFEFYEASITWYKALFISIMQLQTLQLEDWKCMNTSIAYPSGRLRQCGIMISVLRR